MAVIIISRAKNQRKANHISRSASYQKSLNQQQRCKSLAKFQYEKKIQNKNPKIATTKRGKIGQPVVSQPI